MQCCSICRTGVYVLTTRVTSHRYSLAFVLLAVVLGLTACAGSSPAPPSPAPAGALGGYLDYVGPTSLKERIAWADVIARVRLQSVAAGSERWKMVYHDSHIADPSKNIGTLEHRFEVLEYLKGSGGGEIMAVVFEFTGDFGYDTAERAAADGNALLAGRNTQWDDRDAIVFLRTDHPWMLDLPRAGRYWLGAVSTHLGYAGDHYTVASPWDKNWLPSASSGGASGASDGQRFLLDVPGSASTGASGQSGRPPTITLAEMKAEVAAIEREAAAGGGSEAYRDCLYEKYKWRREVDYIKGDGEYFYKRHDSAIGSGLAAGTLVYAQYPLERNEWNEQTAIPTPDWDWGEYRIVGRDHDLFVPQWPGVADTARPLPAGEYQFYYSTWGREHIICGAQPEEEQKRHEVFVAVTAPTGSIHEAFFDPAAIGAAVGADGTNGALKPTAFSVGGVSTALQGLKWESGTVTLELSPAASLSGHALDFISLDGSVSLSLDGGAATVSGGTLTWSVADQPWQAGDLLMLRIRQA